MDFQRHGFFVVVILLTMQYVIILLVAWQLYQSQRDEQTISHARESAIVLHRLVWETTDGLFKMHMDSATEGLIDDTTTAREKVKFKKRVYSVLEKKWSLNEEPFLRALQKSTEDMLTVLDWIQNQMSLGRAHWRKVDNDCAERVCQAMLGFVSNAGAIVNIEEAKLLHEQLWQDQSRRRLQAILVGSVFGSSVLSILLFMWVAGLLKRLLRVIENSRRLALREPLESALKGQDEISTLDRTLHSVADALNEAFARESAMLENASNLVCSLDKKLTFSKSNRYAERLLGLSADDIVGQNVLDFVAEEDRARVEQLFASLHAKAEIVKFEARMRSIDRSTIVDTRWSVQWSWTQSSFFCVIHDITDEKNIERLRQDFLDMISHDLRSPLMSIQGSITLIAEGVRGPVSANLHKDMESANQNIEVLMNFVNDLLELQHLQSATLELSKSEFELESLIEEVANLLIENARTKGVDVQLPDGHWIIKADRQKLSRAFLNFLSNAIKYSPPNSEIVIDVKEIGSQLELSVTDDGPGIEPEFAARIFEPFQQLPDEKSKEGTGLGLAISKLVAEKHGGATGVRPGYSGVGSTFWISFPRQ
jgi:PAS domain S-box-containing protein